MPATNVRKIDGDGTLDRLQGDDECRVYSRTRDLVVARCHNAGETSGHTTRADSHAGDGAPVGHRTRPYGAESVIAL